jgi:hypothetical protein
VSSDSHVGETIITQGAAEDNIEGQPNTETYAAVARVEPEHASSRLYYRPCEGQYDERAGEGSRSRLVLGR